MRLCSLLFLVLTASLVLALSNNAFSYGSTDFPNSSNVIEVHLLVVCDKEFGDRFNQDRQKIIEYWTAYLWDINLKFKSLTRVDISFKISRLVTIKNITDQSFLEEVKKSEGNYVGFLTKNKFSKWVYVHHNITDFDIAVLATGLSTNMGSFYPHGVACRIDDDKKGYISILLPFFLVGGNSGCDGLDLSLAYFLGIWSDCYDGRFISHGVGEKCAQRYTFSECTDKSIADYVNSSEASCLQSHNGKGDDDVIQAFSVNPKPLSFDDQCRFLTGNSSVFAEMGESPCMLGSCRQGQPGNSTFIQDLYPLDNSPCGEDKFCFRGQCLDYSDQIQNVGTEKCLQSSNRFSSNDTLVMQTCVPISYPFDSFRILNMKEHGTFLATPYSFPGASETDDKCLGLDSSQKTIQYMNCTTTEKEWLEWDLIATDNRKQEEFLIYNRLAKGCAISGSNGVQISQNCDVSNRLMRWRFHHRKPSQVIFLKSSVGKATTPVSISTINPTVLEFATSEATTTTTEDEILKESTPEFTEITINGETELEDTTPLPVSFQALAFLLIIFLSGVVTVSILYYALQRNCKICKK